MGYALWLPAALRAEGLTVIETPGWQTRGSSTFYPRGIVCHHTASAGGDHPALGIVTNGRPDLAGPLCNVLLARSGDCYVVAAGRANHAGTGAWRGATGNTSMLGIEAENNGIGEPWPAQQIDAYHRLCAAMCKGGRFGPEMVCYHREWATPRGRKIDPAGPGIPQDGNQWRAAVAAALTNTGDLTIMDSDTKAYLDAHFLDIGVKQQALEKDIAKLADQEKRHHGKLRELMDAIKAKVGA